jgi:hypothetical protein
MPYHLEYRWGRVGAVYASDICQFRDSTLTVCIPLDVYLMGVYLMGVHLTGRASHGRVHH